MEISKPITPIWTPNALDADDIMFYTRINKSTGHVPTGDTLLIGDDGRKTNYVVFTGKPMHGYWIDKGDHFESIDFMGDKKIIRKNQCEKCACIHL